MQAAGTVTFLAAHAFLRPGANQTSQAILVALRAVACGVA